MKNIFLLILIIILVIVFLLPEFLNLSNYNKINKLKGPVKSEYYP